MKYLKPEMDKELFRISDEIMNNEFDSGLGGGGATTTTHAASTTSTSSQSDEEAGDGEFGSDNISIIIG